MIAQETGIDSELVLGGRGEFTVWVDETKVAEKSRRGFPNDSELVSAVKSALLD